MVLPRLPGGFGPAPRVLFRANQAPNHPEDIDRKVVYVQEWGGEGAPEVEVTSRSGTGRVGTGPVKVVVEGCLPGCVVNLRSNPISGVVEVINSVSTVVDMSSLAHNVPTIQIDQCSDCTVRVPERWGEARGQGLLYSAAVTGLVLVRQGQSFPIILPDGAPELHERAQFVSRFVDNELLTEMVVREGGGYATTSREKQAADARDLAVDAKFEEMVARQVDAHFAHLARDGKKTAHQAVDETTDSAGQEDSDESFPRSALLGSITAFNKMKLRPTTTAVSSTPVGVGRGDFTAHATDEEVQEHFDSPEELEVKVQWLADRISSARHFVVYTGAGVSTSAKIPDYRGPQGVWTLKEQGKTAKMEITLEQALPTKAHMALVALAKAGFLKAVVSTNVDGLHRRSGLDPVLLSELHGNCYIETCETCHREYLRTYDVTALRKRPSAEHYTGRSCDLNSCLGKLKDSIINFGETLPEGPVSLASAHSEAQDLALVLGSSMRVQPAASYPDRVRQNDDGALAIVNLQHTPYDKYCKQKIYARTDLVMELVCSRLGVEIPEYETIEDRVAA